ncbi:unnamed protein product [Cylicocyclus nassatus]|uniref:Uncharacterized protein n=1 Tax=Cylicocyclus nassatus TaxID=53992 RepID=A0AA36GP53_CYLNA|nr:unnamed protein product [Cylicocyclus nassatus]
MPLSKVAQGHVLQMREIRALFTRMLGGTRTMMDGEVVGVRQPASGIVHSVLRGTISFAWQTTFAQVRICGGWKLNDQKKRTSNARHEVAFSRKPGGPLSARNFITRRITKFLQEVNLRRRQLTAHSFSGAAIREEFLECHAVRKMEDCRSLCQ